MLTQTRPADVRGSINAIATHTLEAAKQDAKPPPAKRRKTNNNNSRKTTKPPAKEVDDQESYHFIGYVPFAGKVWELDGLKSGPLEVGEIPEETSDGWMEVVRPALRRKMQKYSGGDGDNIRFNLLAIVQDQYTKVSDQLELLKREKAALERRLDGECAGWSEEVEQNLLRCSELSSRCCSRWIKHFLPAQTKFSSLPLRQEESMLLTLEQREWIKISGSWKCQFGISSVLGSNVSRQR